MTKSLIVSLAIILLLFVLSAILSSFCMNTVHELQAITNALPDELEDIDVHMLSEIDALWSRRRFVLSLMLKKELIVNTDISVKTLCAYGSSDTEGDYHYARYTLLSNLNAIAEIEGITIEAIF